MRIAYFSPVNPQPSGISDYSEALLPHLATRLDSIDLFIEDYTPANKLAAVNIRVRPWQEFESDYRADCYDAVLYHIGNNPFHVYVYDFALRIPGVLVLHEFNLHYLVAHATLAREGCDENWPAYLHEVEYDAGSLALERARDAQAGTRPLDYDGVALNRRLLERSRAAIVHSDYMVERLRGAGYALPVQKIPHGADLPAIDRAAARQYLAQRSGMAIDDATPVFGIFGFLKPYKRIHESLRAFARLRRERPEARLVLVGEEHPHYPLRPLIAELGLDDAVRILGYVPVNEFTTCLAATDYCINLRRPTAGETSGSFLRALSLGKPTLVSNIGSFVELPESIAFKLPVDDREEHWIYEYMRLLLDEPELARDVGDAGRDYVREHCLWPRVADQYVRFLAQYAKVEPVSASLAPRAVEAHTSNGKALYTDVSDDELAEYIVGFSHASKPMEEYVLLHLDRLVKTVKMTPLAHDVDRILELGCYMQMTPALQRYLGYREVRGAYYGRVGEEATRTALSVAGETFSCQVDLFDAERDRYPYPDGHFSAVLCCELIEHLQNDPMHLMAEINRILAPGGYLLLSTPNIASLRAVYAVLHGYHPGWFTQYIKPAPDGTVDPRHSREYTPREIAQLAEYSGFHVERLETGSYGSEEAGRETVREFLASNQLSTELRGDVIYCLARKTGPVRDRWPKELYYP